MADGTLINGKRIAGRSLLGARRILDEKAHWDALALCFERERKPAHACLWRPGWIPLSYNDETIVALAPSPCFGGPAGQVIAIHLKDGTGWQIEYGSLEAWLEDVVLLSQPRTVDLGWPERGHGFDFCGELEGRFERAHQVTPPAPSLELTLLQRIRADDIEGVRAVLAEGASLTVPKGVEFDALYWGFSNTETPTGPATLLHYAAVASPRTRTIGGPVPNADIAALLLDRGLDVNAREAFGDTPLHFAVRNQNVPLMRLLLTRGADVNAIDCQGTAPIDHTMNIDLIELLLNHKADPNGGPRIGRQTITSLGHMGEPSARSLIENLAAEGHENTIRFLLDAGADLERHERALELACKHGHADTFELLLERGMDPNRAFEVALEARELFVRKMLQRGADPNTRWFEESALIHAVRGNKHAHAAILLKNGADPHVLGRNGKSVFELAEAAYLAGENDARVVMNLLKDAGAGPKKPKAAPSIAAELPSGPTAGARVVHAKFGEGVITKVDKETFHIAFDSGEKKSLLARFVRLI